MEKYFKQKHNWKTIQIELYKAVYFKSHSTYILIWVMLTDLAVFLELMWLSEKYNLTASQKIKSYGS